MYKNTAGAGKGHTVAYAEMPIIVNTHRRLNAIIHFKHDLKKKQ